MSCVGDIGGNKKKFDAHDYQNRVFTVTPSGSFIDFPYETEHSVILGPDVIATKDGNWIQWRGAVYARVEAIIHDADE